MAKMIDNKPEYHGEAFTWESFLHNLPNEVVVYNHREINGKEFDFCILLKNMGILVVEVKGWRYEDIFDVAGVDEIIVSGYSKPQRSPKKQARAYRFGLLNMINDKYNVSPLIFDMVCYPFLSKKEYLEKRLDVISEPEMTLFKEDLADSMSLGGKISSAFDMYKSIPHTTLGDSLMMRIRQHFEPKTIVEETKNGQVPFPYSIVSVFPNGLTKNDILEVIDNYFNGIKQIVFTDKKNGIVELIESLKQEYIQRNIFVNGNNLSLNSKDKKEVGKNKSSYRSFIFEAYEIEDIIDLCDREIKIVEGRCCESEKSMLYALSKKSSFNHQQFFIEHAAGDKNILVKAGAGTGKTFSMVSRVAYLCYKNDNPVINIIEDIAMVTFTNDAADNMKSRIKQMFINYFVLTRNPKHLKRIEDVNQMQISTIHKFAQTIVQKASLGLGLGYDFGIASGDFFKEQIYEKYLNEFIIKKSKENPNFIKELRIPIYQFKKILMAFAGQLYNKSIDIKSIALADLGHPIASMPFFNEIIQEVIIASEIEYSEKILENNKIDLRESMILLNTIINGSYKDKCNLHLKHLFVDEFQDTDDTQIDSFLKLQKIVGNECKLFVVGDLKQSIYRFRGATISAFKMLNVTPDSWEEHTLSTNYRTDKRLLKIFDKLFTRLGNKGYLPYVNGEDSLSSDIYAGAADGELFICAQFHGKNEEEFYDTLFETLEIQRERLQKLDSEKRLSKEEKTIALLVRENWQIDKIVKEAKKREIQIDTKVAGDLYQLTPAMDLYKLLMALNSPSEPVYLVNFIESNYFNLKLDYQKLHGKTYEEKQCEIIKILDEYFNLHTGIKWNGVVCFSHSKPILFVLKKIYEALKPWEQFDDDADKQRFYRSNYELVLEKIIKYYSIDYLSLNVICKFMRVNILSGQNEMARNIEKDNSGITCLCTTIHKAKGLEYGTVILPFTNHSIGNLKKADLDVNFINSKLAYSIKVDEFGNRENNSNYDAVEEVSQRISEESRVLYVALTRAIRNCIWMKDLDKRCDISWSTFLEE